MVRRLTVVALIVSGAVLIFSGTRTWLEHREIRAVVHSLMSALKTGDRQAVQTLLPRDHPSLDDGRRDSRDPAFWSPDGDLTYEILDVDFSGNRAVADVRIQKDGFQIQPRVHLVRSTTARWKIDYVDNVSVDPLWYDQLDAQSRQEGEETAQELDRLLKDRPGVIMERVKVPVDDDIQ